MNRTSHERVKNLLESLTVTPLQFKELVESIDDEIKRGLSAHHHDPLRWNPSVSSLKMLDSHIPFRLNQLHQGISYSIHLSKTTVTMVRMFLRLDGTKNLSKAEGTNSLPSARLAKFAHKEWKLDVNEQKLRKGSSISTNVFNSLAVWLQEFMDQFGDIERWRGMSHLNGRSVSERAMQDHEVEPSGKNNPVPLYPVSVSFGWPVLQTKLNRAQLIYWDEKSDQEERDPLAGCEICSSLDAVLKDLKLPVQVVAYATETIGLFFSAAWKNESRVQAECDQRTDFIMCIMLENGIDACYVEKDEKILGDYKGQYISLECAYLNRSLPASSIDFELDFMNAESQGHYLLEKMISLPHLAELTRLSLIKIFEWAMPQRSWQAWSLIGEDFIRIVTDESPVCRTVILDVIERAWGRAPQFYKENDCSERTVNSKNGDMPNVNELDVIYMVAKALLARAAAITAALIIAVGRRCELIPPNELMMSATKRIKTNATRKGIGLVGEICKLESFKQSLRDWINTGLRWDEPYMSDLCSEEIDNLSELIDLIDLPGHTAVEGFALVSALGSMSAEGDFGPRMVQQHMATPSLDK